MIQTSTVIEVRAALGEVLDRLGGAARLVDLAQARVLDALAVLDAQHHEALVPVELHRAEADLARGRQLIGGGVTAVAA
ncbi:MAG: hypothetical protein H0W01_11720, partial [Pseudonocardiales bacterium]|nr:hypothetical protein [Pseudonocardiales bacterium]